jgi:hypothetical protein
VLDLPDAEDADRVADWVELLLNVEGESISRSKLSSILEQSSGSEATESFVSDVWRHLQRRQGLYATQYFEVVGDLARAKDPVANSVEYRLCLLFSLYGASTQRGVDPKLFERMSAEAICSYLGGSVFVFGWPVLPNVQPAIADRVRQAAELLNERFVEDPGTQYKDRGVDVIAWKNFVKPTADVHRSGRLVVLSQCAAGREWRKKTRELPYKSWTQYIHWATDPMVGFAVPCVVDDRAWQDVAREVDGIVFDRVRLLNSLLTGVKDADLRNELASYIDEQIREATA